MLGSIEWDFEKLFMKFTWNDKEMVLCGTTNSQHIVVDVAPITMLYKQQQGIILHALDVTNPRTKLDHILPLIKDFLQSYSKVLNMPTGLPPQLP